MDDPAGRRARRRRWRAAADVWRFWGEAPDTPPWVGQRDGWVVLTRLRYLAVALPVIALAVVIGKVAGALPLSRPLVGTALLGCVIASVCAGLLARALGAAVVEDSTGSIAWFRSRERAHSLARIRAEGASFFAVYAALGAAVFVAAVVALVAIYVGMFTGATWEEQNAALRDTQSAVQPYAAAALSVATLGAISLVNSAFKELAVLRAEVAYRNRQAEKETG